MVLLLISEKFYFSLKRVFDTHCNLYFNFGFLSFFHQSQNCMEDEDCNSLKSCGFLFVVFPKAKIGISKKTNLLSP